MNLENNSDAQSSKGRDLKILGVYCLFLLLVGYGANFIVVYFSIPLTLVNVLIMNTLGFTVTLIFVIYLSRWFLRRSTREALGLRKNEFFESLLYVGVIYFLAICLPMLVMFLITKADINRALGQWAVTALNRPIPRITTPYSSTNRSISMDPIRPEYCIIHAGIPI